jgi:hypothetical protein
MAPHHIFKITLEEVLLLGRWGIHCGRIRSAAFAKYLGKEQWQLGEDSSWHQRRDAA